VRRETFERIYRDNTWRGTETRAGPGSSLQATAHLRRELPKLCEELGIASVLEAGCSEAWWQPELPGYIGVDIVADALERARANHPTWTFLLADICTDPLPRCDAVLCRQVLQHLSLEDGLAAVDNFRRSGAEYLIATSATRGGNRSVPTGTHYRCRPSDPPFNLGPPLRSIPDAAWWYVAEDPTPRSVEPQSLDVWRLR
jgi:hypothetical protein